MCKTIALTSWVVGPTRSNLKSASRWLVAVVRIMPKQVNFPSNVRNSGWNLLRAIKYSLSSPFIG